MAGTLGRALRPQGANPRTCLDPRRGERNLSPTCSVVVVSWNTRADLMRCLDSLMRHSRAVELELIVVDNGSVDGTREELRASYPHVRVIENKENAGFARGCNQGMEAATGEFLLLLNPDTYVEADLIGNSVQLMLERPEIGALGCRVCWPDGRLQHTANRKLSVRRSLIERLWLYKFVPAARRPKLLLDGYWDHDEELEVDWLAGVFMLLRRELFERSGGFDERFFMYGEDSEWCMRLGRLGYRIFFSPEPGTLFHTGSVSSDLVWGEKDRLRRCYVGGIESYKAVNGPTRALAYRAAELAGSMVRFAVYSVLSRLRSDSYYAGQATFYRWLVEFYLRG